METKSEYIILLHETWWQSLVRDLGTATAIILVIGAGTYMQSTAMQWMGFILLILTVIAKANATGKNSKKTPQQAADYIFKKFNVKAGV